MIYSCFITNFLETCIHTERKQKRFLGIIKNKLGNYTTLMLKLGNMNADIKLLYIYIYKK